MFVIAQSRFQSNVSDHSKYLKNATVENIAMTKKKKKKTAYGSTCFHHIPTTQLCFVVNKVTERKIYVENRVDVSQRD